MTREATPDGFDSSHDRIDELCDAFEAAWRNGPRPQILEFVARGPQELRSKLFYDLLLVELELRREAGEEPTQAEYLKSFSEFGPVIESVAFSYGDSAFKAPLANLEVTSGSEGHKKGDRISHYQLVEKIGEGAMGEVWKATDARLNRPVAIKLPRAQALTEDELKRFLREGQAVGQLKHPQLAAVYDIGRWGNSAYIVVDFVEGENLRKRIDRGKLNQREIVEICADVAEALHHAHERGVVHRDLKPANIIVDPHGRSHVIDFGLAKWVTDERDLTLHGELLGTPAYMSPEQARGEGAKAGPATDIYSLGAVLYEMLTGECPFTGGHASVLYKIANAVPESPRQKMDDVPRDLDTICLKALEKDSLRRFKTIQEMAVDLRRFERGEPILSRPPGSVEKAWRWVRRHPTLLAAALIGVFAIGISLLAGSLAHQNKALQGFQVIDMTTNPPGARAAFARLSDIGELLPNQITPATGTTPVEVDLLPGDYLVEVVWPDGRFHQVFRRVPNWQQPSDASTNHRYRNIASASKIILSEIDCPPADVTVGMQETKLPDDAAQNSIVTARSRAFLADPDFLTYRKVRSQYPKYGKPNHNDSEMCKLTFSDAAGLAEALGKRLPTRLEFQLLSSKSMEPTSLSPNIADANTLQIDRTSIQSALNGDDKQNRFLRYTAPYVPKGQVLMVRSIRPLLITN